MTKWTLRRGTWGAALLSVAALGLAACGTSSANSDAGSASASAKGCGAAAGCVASVRALLPASVQSSNVLSDYVNLPYVPMEFYVAGTHTLTGIDIDITQALAKVFGVKVQYTNVQFSELFTAVSSGRAQFVISGAYDAPARRGTYTYIDYFRTGTQMITTRADATKYHITGIKSLCGKTVVTGVGTDYIPEVQKLSQKYCGSSNSITQLYQQSIAEAQIDVTDGRAQAIVNMGPEAAQYIIDHQPGGKAGTWTEVGPLYYPTDYGAIFAKGSPYIKPFEAAFKTIFHDGAYQKVLAKWDVSKQALSAPTINAGPSIP